MVQTYLQEIAPQVAPPTKDRIAQVWLDPDQNAFTFHAPELCGFAIVRHLSDGSHEMSEFYIAPSHRRSGAGVSSARSIIAKYPGRWQLGIASGAQAARDFWLRVLEHHKTKRGPPLTPHQSGSLHFIQRETVT